MRDRILLASYFVAIVLLTSVHDLRLLAAALVFAVLLSVRRCPRIARKVALAILLFNSIVTVSYAVITSIKGDFSVTYVILINLRVFLLTYLTFLVGATLNPFRALAFSGTLLYLVTLTYGQVVTFRRVADDFRLAFKSRVPGRASLRDLVRHRSAMAAFFFGKCSQEAADLGHAMRSRGFFDD